MSDAAVAALDHFVARPHDMLAGMQFDLQYDNTAMTLTAAIGAVANNAGKTLNTTNQAPNVIRFLIVGMNQTAISGGTSVNLSITLNANALAGVSPLTFSNVAGADPNGSPVSVTGSNGAVTIVAPTQYQLTTSVSPAGSGSIVANPASAGGNYNAGTPVQLTATPASGCSFVNWTGALVGTTNPQTVTMSAARSVTEVVALRE